MSLRDTLRTRWSSFSSTCFSTRTAKAFLSGAQAENFGSKMPRVDPAHFSAQDLDADGVKTAAQFARAHEEHLTDWSLGKAEKWQHAVMDCKRARVTRRGSVGSPLHTDSESDGSADMEPAKATRVPLRAAQ